MKNNPLLSIAIPTFNRGETLYKNVNRILENNSTDFEIVISDNNSNDNTYDLISSINDNRIKNNR